MVIGRSWTDDDLVEMKKKPVFFFVFIKKFCFDSEKFIMLFWRGSGSSHFIYWKFWFLFNVTPLYI